MSPEHKKLMENDAARVVNILVGYGLSPDSKELLEIITALFTELYSEQ